VDTLRFTKKRPFGLASFPVVACSPSGMSDENNETNSSASEAAGGTSELIGPTLIYFLWSE
jgi:hypothetical protein